MLFSRQFHFGGVFWSRPINQADVLVRLVDAMDVEKARRDERTRAGRSCRRTFADQFHVESAFFFRLAQRSLLRVFVQLDVPAERQPFAKFAVVYDENLFVVNNKNRDGEINFFVDVGHVAGEIYASKFFNCFNPQRIGSQPTANDSATKATMYTNANAMCA